MVALSPLDMAGGAQCGRCIRIKTAKYQLTATVTTTCTTCKSGTIMLNAELAEILNDKKPVGKQMAIEWEPTLCPDTDLATVYSWTKLA